MFDGRTKLGRRVLARINKRLAGPNILSGLISFTMGDSAQSLVVQESDRGNRHCITFA
jgi:hypothetical protein